MAANAHRPLLLLLLAVSAAAWRLPMACMPPVRCGLLRTSAPLASAESTESLDTLIAQMRQSTPEQLQQLLGANLKSIDAKLFLRLAEMSDAETDDYEKLRIRQLATTVTKQLEELLAAADAQMSEDASTVQKLLGVLASPNGEFELPLAAERLEALRVSLRESIGGLDEGFVGTVKAYMRKADEDGLDGMVSVLRTLLQAFAAERLRALATGQLGAGDDSTARAVRVAVESSPEEWDEVLKSKLGVGGDGAGSEGIEVSATQLLDALQDKMGEVVLGLASGSQVQSVLAEYLSELIGKVRAIAAEE